MTDYEMTIDIWTREKRRILEDRTDKGCFVVAEKIVKYKGREKKVRSYGVFDSQGRSMGICLDKETADRLRQRIRR